MKLKTGGHIEESSENQNPNDITVYGVMNLKEEKWSPMTRT
jgi:hypothetical protein